MAEKVKVSREVAEAVNWSINWHKQHRGDLVRLDELHAEMLSLSNQEAFQGEHEEILNTVPTYELARMLILGFEIKQTPEEKVAEYFKLELEIVESPEGQYSPIAVVESRGRVRAIEYVLMELGLKIEGINKWGD